jgi:hypothetical protein
MSRRTHRSRTSTKTGNRNGRCRATNSRRWWRQAKRFTPAALGTLRNFFDARNGSAEPFYYYDPYDTSPKLSYDSTGVATVGRYIVRFNGDWQQSSGPGRSDTQIELLELA